MKMRHRRPKVVGAISPGTDPQGMDTLMCAYVESARVRAFSEHTIRSRIYSLKQLQRWCADRGILQPREVTKPILERFQHYLFLVRKKDGHLLSMKTQADRLISVKVFFRYLSRHNIILSNPAADLELPRLSKRLPHCVLSVEEVERVLAVPSTSDPLGVRDRAILETFYSTGMRRGELMRLLPSDVDRRREIVVIREGKGKKERVVPIGERALLWIEKYVAEVRTHLVVGKDPGDLFLSVEGGALSESWLSRRVAFYVRKAGLGKQGGCHVFRHTMATLMLEGGADIRFIQEMLGHTKLETTQIYTRVSIRKLKEIHTATHPGAKLQGVEGEEQAAAECEPARPEEAVVAALAAPVKSAPPGAPGAVDGTPGRDPDRVRYSGNTKLRVRAHTRAALPEAGDRPAEHLSELEALQATLAAEASEEPQD